MATTYEYPSPVLPDWVPRSELSRPSAERVSQAENRQQTLTYAGPNEVIPVVWGEQVVGGPIIAGPQVNGSSLVWAVALSWAGENGIEKVEDVRVGEAIGTFANISNVNTGATASAGGVTARVFDGRQTTAHSELTGAIPGFTDTFSGIAYAILRITAANFTSLPQVTFRVKGRKCYDPRTEVTAWTENPVLFMRDFVTNDEIGMGSELIGVEAAADVADSLYSGLPRTRAGLAIQDPMTEEDALSLFAQYAEVLWSYEDEGVRIIPDAPVDEIHEIDVEHIREGSLSLTTVGLDQIPTEVRILFTDRATNPEWFSRPAIAAVPEHELEGLPTAASSVPLPGVFNRFEAERRAFQRLHRLQTPGRIQWQMFAPGMKYQAGDVVRLPNVKGLQSINVRITAQPEMIAPMLYQMGGEIYRASNYPEGSDGVAIPVGAIVILRGAQPVPAGWSLMPINNRLVCEGAPGNAGSTSSVSASFTTSSAGAHLGSQNPGTYETVYMDPPGTHPDQEGQKLYYTNNLSTSPQPIGEHTHSASVSVNIYNAANKLRTRFVKRTGAPVLLPPNFCFLGASNLSSEYAVESLSAVNRYLAGGSSEQLGGTAGYTGTTSQAPNHRHNPRLGQERGPLIPYLSGSVGEDAGAHSHTYSAGGSVQLRSMALALFESLGEAGLPPGAIVAWDQAAPPEGWAFCDGSNGTIDLSDRFIYITRIEQAGLEHRSESTASLWVSGPTSVSGNHVHARWRGVRGDGLSWGQNRLPFHHDPVGGHSHDVYGSTTRSLTNITRYNLRFIQYIGT